MQGNRVAVDRRKGIRWCRETRYFDTLSVIWQLQSQVTAVAHYSPTCCCCGLLKPLARILLFILLLSYTFSKHDCVEALCKRWFDSVIKYVWDEEKKGKILSRRTTATCFVCCVAYFNLLCAVTIVAAAAAAKAGESTPTRQASFSCALHNN